MATFRAVCIVVALILLALPARAQTNPVLRPGDWVRVQPKVGQRSSGALMVLADEQLSIETNRGFPIQFQLSDIARLELSVGRDRDRGAKMGAAIGGFGGLAVGALTSVLGIPRGGGASFAVIGFPLVAIPAGAVLGALIPPHRYVDVSESVLNR